MKAKRGKVNEETPDGSFTAHLTTVHLDPDADKGCPAFQLIDSILFEILPLSPARGTHLSLLFSAPAWSCARLD
jgi:hypothetical protein